VRLGWTGELRAIGDVLRDQLFSMQRVGFDAYAVRADRDIHDALKGLSDFSETYQASVDQKAAVPPPRPPGGQQRRRRHLIGAAMSDLSKLIADTRHAVPHRQRFSPAVFASSLAAEDMVLTDLILKAG
jgi:hypothetical protein